MIDQQAATNHRTDCRTHNQTYLTGCVMGRLLDCFASGSSPCLELNYNTKAWCYTTEKVNVNVTCNKSQRKSFKTCLRS